MKEENKKVSNRPYPRTAPRSIRIIKSDKKGYGYEIENPIVVKDLSVLECFVDALRLNNEKYGQNYNTCTNNFKYPYDIYEFEINFSTKLLTNEIIKIYITPLSLSLKDLNYNNAFDDIKLPEGLQITDWRPSYKDYIHPFRDYDNHINEKDIMIYMNGKKGTIHVDRMLPQVLKHFVQNKEKPINTYEISKAFSLSKPRSFNILCDLDEYGFVCKDKTAFGKYSTINENEFKEIFEFEEKE